MKFHRAENKNDMSLNRIEQYLNSYDGLKMRMDLRTEIANDQTKVEPKPTAKDYFSFFF